jgi:formamidopyrimidine-DNA glycosylase
MNCTPATFADGLVNRKILDIKRHGKYLWFEMADRQSLTPIFHFGMSGGFRIKSAPDVTYLTEVKHRKMKAKNEIDGQCESFVYGNLNQILIKTEEKKNSEFMNFLNDFI